MKRPWNLPDVPIYSLATYRDHTVNMNICTYVSAVSMEPKLYMVAVYHQTQTLDRLKHHDSAVLQLLGKQHLPLINTLGKKSGKNYNKESYLTKREQLEIWCNKKVLKNSAARMDLKTRWVREAGDHTLYVFDVVGFQTNHTDILTMNDLRINKLVRI